MFRRLLSSSDRRDTVLRFLKRRPPRTPSSEGRRDEHTVAVIPNICPVRVGRRHEAISSRATVPSYGGGQSLPPIAPDSCGRGIGAEFLISNRSPMRGPKLVGGFHLPSAVCPPSVFGETPADRNWQEPRALDEPGAQSFMTHNPHRGGRNWSVASAFRPTFVRLRSSPGGWRRRERSPSCRLSRPDARRSLSGHPQVGTNADERRSARRRPRRRRRPRHQFGHNRPASRINFPVRSRAFEGRD